MARTLHEQKNVRKIEAFSIDGHVEGASVDAYVAVLDLDTHGQRNKTIILEETGTNDIKYKLEVAASQQGALREEVAETVLSASGIAKITLRKAYARVVLSLASNVGSTHGAYVADYIMEGV